MQKTFQQTVGSWIRSYRNPEALDFLRRFVDNSTAPDEVKESLRSQIDAKEQRLRQAPQFVTLNGTTYLADEQWKPREYLTRFGAVCKMAELALKGYEVDLQQTGTIYIITAQIN